MSKNFLNFLTTSVIILSCGTAINSSSCYCMESKILSPQNQELSQKLLTELSKMDADIKDELKRKQIIVDKNGQPIEDASFLNITDGLRSTQVTCINNLTKVLKIVGASEDHIQSVDDCMTYCLLLGSQIGTSLIQLWHNYCNKVSEAIKNLLDDTNSCSDQLYKFNDDADNNDNSNFITGSSLLLDAIKTILTKLLTNLSNYNNYDHVLQNELISKLHMSILELQQLLKNPSHPITDDIITDDIYDILQLSNDPCENIMLKCYKYNQISKPLSVDYNYYNKNAILQSSNYKLETILGKAYNPISKQPSKDPSSINNDYRKNTHDSLKKDLMSQLSNIISGLQQLDRELSTHANDTAKFLQAISVSYPIEALTNIMGKAGEKFNIANIGTNMITWQQFLNYFNNKILLVSINQMRNINPLIKKNKLMNLTKLKQTTNKQIITCCDKVLRIAYNLKEYLSNMSNNSNLDYKQRALAKNVNENQYINRCINDLQNATNQLQEIENKYNNKNIKNIKKDNNNSVPNESFIKFKNALNNIEPIENIKQSKNSKNIKHVEDSNITEAHSNSILNDAVLKSRDKFNNSAQIINNNNLIKIEDEKITKEDNNSVPNNIVLKPSNDINNSEQIANSNLTNEVLSESGEDSNSNESSENSNLTSEVSSESGEDSNSNELSEKSNLTIEGSSELSGNSNSNELSENSNLTIEGSSELSANSNSNELSENSNLTSEVSSELSGNSNSNE